MAPFCPLDLNAVIDAGRFLVAQADPPSWFAFLIHTSTRSMRRRPQRARGGLPEHRSDRIRRSAAINGRVRALLDSRGERLCRADPARLLTRLEKALREMGVNAPLLIGNSNGGLSTSEMAQSRPVFFITLRPFRRGSWRGPSRRGY